MVEKLEQDNLYIPDPLDITFENAIEITIWGRPKRLDKVDWQPDTTNGKKVFEYIDKLWWKWKITVGKSSENQYDIRVQKRELIESTGETQRKTQRYYTWIIANDEEEFSKSLLKILDEQIWTVDEGKRGEFKRTQKRIFRDLSTKPDTLWNGHETFIKYDYDKTKIKEIFDIRDKIIDLSWSWQKWQNKRYENYLLHNEFWNTNYQWPIQRKKVIDWFCRMVESWDINTIFREADALWVPRQCIYLALAESGWQAWANSWVATGWWQFTRSSARLFKLNKKWWPDNRWDMLLSTQAAMRHLKENYNLVCNYAKQLGLGDKLSESDKWYLAFSMFNWSPGLIQSWMIACKWNINDYPDKLKPVNWKKENNNYVPRILAIERILEEAFIDNDYDIEKVKASESILRLPIHAKTEADIMYETYENEADNLTNDQKKQKLNEIKEKYKQEYQEKKITQRYYEWAINRIKKVEASLDATNKTTADIEYERYTNSKGYTTINTKIIWLNSIKDEYEQEYNRWEITETYYKWAINVINKEIEWLKNLRKSNK